MCDCAVRSHATEHDGPPPLSEPIAGPPGSRNIFPDKIGPQIFVLKDNKTILKAGESVQPTEASNMRFISEKTSIPVPEVYKVYEDQGVTCIEMEYIQGEPLADKWDEMSCDTRKKVITELGQYIRQLQKLPGEFYGSLHRGPCEDIFFKHFPLVHSYKAIYGPYDNREAYNHGLTEALRRSRPNGVLSEDDRELEQHIRLLADGGINFTHGDLNMSNILVGEQGGITGIIDWEAAGYSFKERDYVEAKMQARVPTWKNALNDLFCDVDKTTLDTYKKLDQALVLYSGS